MAVSASGSQGRYIPLFWRLFLPNAVVLLVAGVALWVQPPNGRIVALAGGLLVLLVVNVLLMRRAFAPLAALTDAMRRADLLQPGRRIQIEADPSEVTVLGDAFNEMLERLERERRESGRRALAAEEAERRRIAAELHDEIGQNLTALSLQLGHLAEAGDDGVRGDALAARELTLETVEAVRRLSRQLRPEALDDLGLVAALASLCERMAEHGGVRINTILDPELPSVSPEAELVLYRVAQESLTNVVRHARASRADVTLSGAPDAVTLEVVDDGIGPSDRMAESPGGVRFMRERAIDVGAQLWIEPAPGGGTRVRLVVPREI
ncbi:MAG TPA: sensor histidine kinase [Solirubrobacteraceae bacterium]|nr:sensor histidine kinase [Solirubrobacteraceae bacterium]